MIYVNTVFMLNITINVSLSLNSGVKYFVSQKNDKPSIDFNV